MQNFDIYCKLAVTQGCNTSHRIKTQVVIDDRVKSGDILTIPKNVTSIVDGKFGNTEYVVFPDENNDLKRIYLSWFNRSSTKGTVRESLQEIGNFETFFAENEGRSFRVDIKKSEEPIETQFGPRFVMSYKFTWIK